MLTTADYVLASLIVFGLPLRAFLGMRRLKGIAEPELPRRRPKLWTRAIVTQWLLVSGVAALWIAHARATHDLGLAFHTGYAMFGVLAGAATITFLARRQRASVATDPELRARVRARLAGAARLLPHAGERFAGFAALAITAGVCEELLFRGYLLWVLTHLAPFWVAAAAQAVLFGVAHAYQGPRGMLLTGLAGAFFTLLLLLTGSILPGMLVHALMDLHAGDLARIAFDASPASADAA